jgi:hypothetical protein
MTILAQAGLDQDRETLVAGVSALIEPRFVSPISCGGPSSLRAVG